ncbi:unnamed protein product, partial [Owenia fusiformis]
MVENDNKVLTQCNDTLPITAIYTNMLSINRIDVEWKTIFQNFPRPTFPDNYKIETFRLGITASSGRLFLERDGMTHPSDVSMACEIEPDDSPRQDTVTCNFTEALPWGQFKHNDRVQFTVSATNGGYLGYFNPEPSVNETQRKYYSGNSRNNDALFIFDTVNPYHCSSTSSCSDALMEFGKDIRKVGVNISWTGWKDDLSGIREYDIDIYLTQQNRSSLRENHPAKKTFQKWTLGDPIPSFTPEIAGTYSIVLTAVDNTGHGGSSGNVETARRLFIYDNNSVVDTVQHKPLKPISASQNFTSGNSTSNKMCHWQHNLQDESGKGESVVFEWTDRFINRYHHMNKILGAVDNYQEREILPEYDDFDEGERTRSEIQNANAIVRFNYTFLKDHSGGRNITTMPEDNWNPTDNVLDQGQRLDIPREDGDTVRLWVRAIDVMGTYVNDSVCVHFDSSPPVIEDIWLVDNDREQLAVHNVRDLYEMRFRFKAFDIHSGLYNVHWKLYDNYTDIEETLGEGHTHVIKIDNTTQDASSYCVPAGQCYGIQYDIKPDRNDFSKPGGTHEHDYFLIITVTNVARLVTTLTLKITIDTSPPHPGVVHDGRSGSVEVDFQQDYTLHAHWSQFFDRESGIMFYRYGFSNSCLEADAFTGINKTSMVENTTLTEVSTTASGPGKYFCTVVAFNGAMEPSEPVCSDGVTIDITPPDVHSIIVDHIHTRPGVVRHGNSTWLITRHGYKQRLNESRCSFREVEVPDISVFAETKYSEYSIGCENGAFINRLYLTQERQLNVNWTGFDVESEIFDFELGLSSTDSPLAPDIMPFKSTNQRPSWNLYHPPLSEGQLIWIIIKATNRARMTTSKVFGPLIIDVTAPKFESEIKVYVEREYLRVDWDSSKVYDAEDAEKLQYLIAIGQDSYHKDMLGFSQLTAGGSCNVSYNNCTAVLLTKLNIHSAHPQALVASIKVTNAAGLSTIASSEPYVHYTTL